MKCPDGHADCKMIETRVRGVVYACAKCKIKFINHNKKAKTDDAETARVIGERQQAISGKRS
jgi:hypothetical protein